MSKIKDTDIQGLIGWILRAGIIISISVVFIGGVFYLYRHGHTVEDYKVFKGVPDFIKTLGGIIEGTFNLKGQAIIQFGIILLIATPILRIIVSSIGFVLERDYLYVGISLLVLLIIFISTITGHGG